MNSDQIWGVVRTILTALVAYAAGKNWIPSGVVPAELVSALMTIGAVVFSIMGKTQFATVSKAAAMVPISSDAQRSVGITTPIAPSA